MLGKTKVGSGFITNELTVDDFPHEGDSGLCLSVGQEPDETI